AASERAAADSRTGAVHWPVRAAGLVARCPVAGESSSGSSSDPRPRSNRPAPPTGPSRPPDAPPRRVWRRALPFFLEKLAERSSIQHLLRPPRVSVRGLLPP